MNQPIFKMAELYSGIAKTEYLKRRREEKETLTKIVLDNLSEIEKIFTTDSNDGRIEGSIPMDILDIGFHDILLKLEILGEIFNKRIVFSLGHTEEFQDYGIILRPYIKYKFLL